MKAVRANGDGSLFYTMNLGVFSPSRTYRAMCYRPKTQGSVAHLASLDTVRALSVLWLVVFHTYFVGYSLGRESGIDDLPAQPWAGFIVMGQLSVDGFLLVSGFLITRIIVREQRRTQSRLRLSRFFFRRLFRVGPGQWFLLALYGIVYAVMTGENEPNCRTYWWRTVLFINNLWPVNDMCLVLTWSLSLEVQFYVAITCVLVGLRTRPYAWNKAACWAGLALTYLVRLATIYGNPTFTFPPDMSAFGDAVGTGYADVIYDKPQSRFGTILCGSLVALYYIEHVEECPKGEAPAPLHSALWLVGIVPASTCCIMVFSFGNPYVYASSQNMSDGLGRFLYASYRLLYTGSLAILLYGWLLLRATVPYDELHPTEHAVVAEGSTEESNNTPPSRSCCYGFMVWFVDHRLWYYIAQVSYGMYLLNPLIITGTYMAKFPVDYSIEGRMATPAYAMLAIVVNTVLTMLGATLLYMAIERPCMDLRNVRCCERHEPPQERAGLSTVPSDDENENNSLLVEMAKLPHGRK